MQVTQNDIDDVISEIYEKCTGKEIPEKGTKEYAEYLDWYNKNIVIELVRMIRELEDAIDERDEYM